MLDIGWSELVLIGVVALIVVGPKDLPIMFKTLGRFTAKARGMAREFQRAMDDAAKASGVGDALKDVKDMTSKKSLGLDALESAATKFEKWSPTLPGGKAAVVAPPAGMAAAPVVPPAQPRGPATQALADKLAVDRAARLAPKKTPQVPADAGAAGPVAAKPVRKAVRRTVVAKASAAEIVPPPVAASSAKPKAKPKAKKSDVV